MAPPCARLGFLGIGLDKAELAGDRSSCQARRSSSSLDIGALGWELVDSRRCEPSSAIEGAGRAMARSQPGPFSRRQAPEMEVGGDCFHGIYCRGSQARSGHEIRVLGNRPAQLARGLARNNLAAARPEIAAEGTSELLFSLE